ncbi:hypothetical protein, partial [Tistrella sp.]|uniref:hypothetical protein n=1 Tax=Tistrella sp. TaxID=2024861 RepID=UPI0025DF0939
HGSIHPSQASNVDNERFRLFPSCHAQFHPIALPAHGCGLCKPHGGRYIGRISVDPPIGGFHCR